MTHVWFCYDSQRLFSITFSVFIFFISERNSYFSLKPVRYILIVLEINSYNNHLITISSVIFWSYQSLQFSCFRVYSNKSYWFLCNKSALDLKFSVLLEGLVNEHQLLNLLLVFQGNLILFYCTDQVIRN